MLWGKLAIGMLLFTGLHTLVWFSTNLQFMKTDIAAKSLQISVLLAIPATMCAYFASKSTYQALDGSVWAVRFIGFGTSYLVFPILTYIMLKESMFTPKTLTCTFLAFIIVLIQIYWR